MECNLCKNRPTFTRPEAYGTCKAGVNLYCIKTTVYVDTIDGLIDVGECPDFELNERGINEYDLTMIKERRSDVF